MIKAVVFDVDDTLYDQETPFQQALVATVALPSAFNIRQAFHAYRQQSGLAYANVANGIWTPADMAINRLNAILDAQNVAPVDRDTALAFQAAYAEGLTKIQLFPGLKAALEELARHFKIGIITNGGTDHQLSKVMQLNMHRWVDRDHILTSQEAGIAKPDPQIFTMMNRKMALRASEVVYVGDCYAMDVVAAKRAGWQAFWFNHRSVEEPDSDCIPDQTVENPFELQELLQALATAQNI